MFQREQKCIEYEVNLIIEDGSEMCVSEQMCFEDARKLYEKLVQCYKTQKYIELNGSNTTKTNKLVMIPSNKIIKIYVEESE